MVAFGFFTLVTLNALLGAPGLLTSSAQTVMVVSAASKSFLAASANKTLKVTLLVTLGAPPF